MDQESPAGRAVTEKILKEDRGQKCRGVVSRHQGGTQSNVKESIGISHQSFHPVMRMSPTQHSWIQGDNAHGTRKATEVTLMERWQNETFGQAPWNNIFAVEAGKEVMQALGQAGEERGREADAWSAMAVDGGDDGEF